MSDLDTSVAPMTDEERVEVTKSASLDFEPWEKADPEGDRRQKRIVAHGNTLILAHKIMRLTKSELVERFAELDAERDAGDETPAAGRMIDALEDAKDFYKAASLVTTGALARMQVVLAALVLREAEKEAA
jgi:hypothetical protein